MNKWDSIFSKGCDRVSLLGNILGGAVLGTHFTSAVVLAGGVGSRFGGEVTKQNALVGGIPALVRSCMAFENSSRIDEIIIVSRKEEIDTVKEYVERYSLKKVRAVVEGGETRAESSRNGAAAVSPKCKYVAIHDAARCLVTEKIIDDTLVAAFRYGAAAAAEKVVDTVKIADERGFIKYTEDRNFVWLVKTPQIFKLSIYETASAITEKDGVEVTDDCMMAEHVGFRVKLVDSGHDNIKLTTKDDLALAEFILSKRQTEETDK